MVIHTFILATNSRFLWHLPLQQQKQVTSVFPPRCKMPPPLNSRSSTQKAPRDTLVYLRFGSFLRRFFFRYQRIILKKKSQLPLNSRSSTQKAPRDTLVYLRFGSFLRRFFFRYQRIILKKKSQLPLNSRSSTQKAPRDTLVYLRFGSFSRRFFFRYQRIILKSLDFSAQIDFFMNFCPRRATKLRSL